MARGKFITFEGIEGTGKTTQILALKRLLIGRGLRVFTTREPGGTTLGNDIRALILRSREETVHAHTELLMMEAARAQHVSAVVEKAISEHAVVICDRFTDATTAYQGYGRGIDLEWIQKLNQFASFGLVPDLTILFDLPVNAALNRAFQRIARGTDVAEDRFEREELAFHQRVREGYLELAKKEPGRFFTVDASDTISNLTKTMEQRVLSLLGVS